MSELQNNDEFSEEDKYGFEDNRIIEKLLKTSRLTARQKLAIQRLRKTYWNQKKGTVIYNDA